MSDEFTTRAMERNAALKAATTTRNNQIDHGNLKYYRDVDRDRVMDAAYAAYNKEVDRINALFPEFPEVYHQ